MTSMCSLSRFGLRNWPGRMPGCIVRRSAVTYCVSTPRIRIDTPVPSGSRPSNRVSARDDRVDHFGDGPVPFHFEFGANGILMGRRGVAKNPHNLVLRQQPAIVQGKEESLAD